MIGLWWGANGGTSATHKIPCSRKNCNWMNDLIFWEERNGEVLSTHEISWNDVDHKEIYDNISKIVQFWKLILAAKKTTFIHNISGTFWVIWCLMPHRLQLSWRKYRFQYPEMLKWDIVATYKNECSRTICNWICIFLSFFEILYRKPCSRKISTHYVISNLNYSDLCKNSIFRCFLQCPTIFEHARYRLTDGLTDGAGFIRTRSECPKKDYL